MRIRCPSCSATYEVADALLDPPRTVRCARCAHDWVATPVEDAPPPLPDPVEEEPAPEPEPVAFGRGPRSWEPVIDSTPDPAHALGIGNKPPSAIERLSVSADFAAHVRRRGRLLTAAWAASFAVLAALGVASYTERDTMMRAWPASKRVYATLGLAPEYSPSPITPPPNSQPSNSQPSHAQTPGAQAPNAQPSTVQTSNAQPSTPQTPNAQPPNGQPSSAQPSGAQRPTTQVTKAPTAPGLR
jgi:predicted Zn finger-like uncharacterized protein